MNKSQWILISAAVALFAVLYFGFDTKPEKQKGIEKQRAGSFASTDINVLLMDAKLGLSSQSAASVMALESDLEKASPDTAKAALLRQLSSLWFQLEKPGIAGHYAEEVAKLLRDEESWSIAGTTYSICIQREQEEKVRSYCTERAVQSLENAASLNPSNIQHKVNLALVYAENPPKDNPMKGILMLVELNKQFPGSVPVLTQLGRLALKTAQFDKAVQRLGQAVSLEPDNPTANCLLSQAYEGLGNAAKATEYKTKCDKLSGH